MKSGTHPLLRLFDVIDPRDFAKVFNPFEVGKIFVEFAAGKHRTDVGSDPDERDPVFVAALVDWARFIGEKYFRYDLRGLERIPRSGPALIVGNHSGGLVTVDAFFVWVAVWDAGGPDRAVYALGHDVVYDEPTLRKYAGRMGVLRAGHEGARRAFEKGHLVLVYPGSDYDSFRPFTERNRVVLAGRTGFVKLALRNRVPVIPLASVGMQESLIVLTRGTRLGQALGLHRLIRSNVLPIAIGIPWGLFTPYIPQFPLPAQVTMEFGEPIRWDFPPDAENDPEIVARCYREVETALQRGVDALAEGRIPFVGSLRSRRTEVSRGRNEDVEGGK
jgi:1-acyl-sn-glycerol-3-phosphate acyltransferase